MINSIKCFFKIDKITPLRKSLSIFIDNLGNRGSQMAVRGFPLSGNYVKGSLFEKVYCVLRMVARLGHA